MSLERKSIRAEVCRILVAAGTAAGSKVSTNRAEAVPQAQVPSLVVHSKEEDIEVRNQTPRIYLRIARILVEGFVEQTADLPNDDQADDLSDQCECALLPNLYLPKLETVVLDVDRTTYEGATFEQEEGGQRLLGAFILTFAFAYEYKVDELEKEGGKARLGAFLAAGVKYDLEPSGGAIDLEAEITLPGP